MPIWSNGKQYDKCQGHDVTYPHGGDCPACELDARSIPGTIHTINIRGEQGDDAYMALSFEDERYTGGMILRLPASQYQHEPERCKAIMREIVSRYNRF